MQGKELTVPPLSLSKRLRRLVRWGSVFFACVLIVGVVWGVGCQKEFTCQNNFDNICGAYACDIAPAVCKTSCQQDSDCASRRGYVCQEKKCICPLGAAGAYCRGECTTDSDCSSASYCIKTFTSDSGQQGTKMVCQCRVCEGSTQDGRCLSILRSLYPSRLSQAKDAGNEDEVLSELAPPEGFPKQCLIISNEPNSSDESADNEVSDIEPAEDEFVADGGD